MGEDHGDWGTWNKGPEVETIDEVEIEKPKLYKVILLNDDFTPIDWVAEILMRHFKKTGSEARLISMQIHKSGKGIAGVYTFDLADTKSKRRANRDIQRSGCTCMGCRRQDAK